MLPTQIAARCLGKDTVIEPGCVVCGTSRFDDQVNLVSAGDGSNRAVGGHHDLDRVVCHFYLGAAKHCVQAHRFAPGSWLDVEHREVEFAAHESLDLVHVGALADPLGEQRLECG